MLYSNLTWDSLRTKLPLFNRMFYSKNLSILNQYSNFNKIKDETDELTTLGVSVEIQKVEEEIITPSLSFSAVLEPLEKVEVHSKVSGRIEKIYLKEGDRIKKGQLLAKLDSLTFELDLAKQKAAKESSMAMYELTKVKYQNAKNNIEMKLGEADKRIATYNRSNLELQRFSEILAKKEILWNQKAISEEEILNLRLDLKSKELLMNNAKRDLEMILIGIKDEDIVSAGYSIPENKKEKIELLKTINTKTEKAELDVALANLNSSEINIKSTEMLIKECLLYSPIEGVVAKVSRSLGELVNAGSGGVAPIMTVISYKGSFATFFINENDLSKLKKKQIANVRVDSLPNKKFTGKVKNISPLVDQKTHTVEAKVELDNKTDELKPGMFVRAEILLGDEEKAISIPIDTLVSVQDSEADIFILKDKKAYKKKVKLGDKRENQIFIKDGLIAGDILILGPINRMFDGVSVYPKFK